MTKFFIHLRADEPWSADKIREIREQLVARGSEYGLKIEHCWDLASLFDELCCNIIDHGQASWFEVEVTSKEGGAPLLTMRDNGTAFNPAQHAELPDSYERGIGLDMVHHMAGDIQYLRKAGGVNELMITTGN